VVRPLLTSCFQALQSQFSREGEFSSSSSTGIRASQFLYLRTKLMVLWTFFLGIAEDF
jgi:hypothetical protein